MIVIRILLRILLFPLAAMAAICFFVANAIANFINDIYDDDMYWGGKD